MKYLDVDTCSYLQYSFVTVGIRGGTHATPA